MFRGYVPVKNKRCLMPFKDRPTGDLLSLEQAKQYDEYAGVLSDDTVVIDIDDVEQSDILFDIVDDLQLRCKVVETTRGKHFYFKNNGISKNGTHLRLAIGLESDIKVGKNNSYVVLKRDKVEREVIYDKFDDEEYQDIPRWLYPVASKIDFLNLEEGEGRNDALFRYILVLQSNNFNRNEIRTCLEIINKYILAEPLDDEELEVILREEAFEKDMYYNGSSFQFDKFAQFLKSSKNVVKIDGKLHIYHEGVYVQGSTNIEREMIRLIPNLSRAKRTEVMEYLPLIAEEVQLASENYIAFKNGIYDIVNDTMIPYDPSIIITNKIPHNYIPDAYYEETDKLIDRIMCNDSDLRELLLESLGYAFYRSNVLRKCFVMVGNRRNGKSTWFDLCTAVLGMENISSLDVKDLNHAFRPAELFGMLANIGDDIDDDYIPSTSIFKKVVAGGRVTVEKKGKDPFAFNSYATVFLSCNNMPRMSDKTGAVIDRLIMIPFDRTFKETDADFDPFIRYKVMKEESLEYLVSLGIKHLKNVLTRNKFTECEKVNKQNEEYDMINNPIKMFFESTDFEGKVTKDVYLQYCLYCTEGGFKPITQIEFSRQVCRHFGYQVVDKRIDGQRYRVFSS